MTSRAHRLTRQVSAAFVLQRARASGEGVLELFSGTGDLSRALDQAALDVVAVEPSEPPPRIAVAAGLGQVVALRQDPRSLRLGRRFGLVLALGSGLRRLATLDDLEAVFATAAYHLADGGSLVVEVDGMANRGMPAERVLLDRRLGFLGVRAETSTARRVLSPHLTRRGDLGPRITRLSLLAVAPSDVFERLALAGLTVAESYADYEGAPFDPQGRRLVAVCHQAPLAASPPRPAG